MESTHTDPFEKDEERESSRPTYSDEGVDLSVIRMMREKSYDERLSWLQRAVEAARRLRHGRRVP